MRRAPASSLLLSLAATSCMMAHSPHNAPGHVDLRKRPKSSGEDPTMEPTAPPAQVVNLAAGPTGGFSFFKTSEPPTSGTLGAEASLLYGHNVQNYGSFTPEGVYTGLNAGLLAAFQPGGVRPRLYAELHLTLFGGSRAYIAAGWLTEGNGRHGPQFTLHAMGLYLRSSTRLDAGTDLEIGLSVVLPWVSWRRSR